MPTDEFEAREYVFDARGEGDVQVRDVQEGDFLTGLDNGYVVEVEPDPPVSFTYSRMATALSGDNVMLTFHTAQGDEAYLIAPEDMPVRVRRESEAGR